VAVTDNITINDETMVCKMVSEEECYSSQETIFRSVKVRFFLCFFATNESLMNLLKQPCQTGGPRAACGPFACFLRPIGIIVKQKFNNLANFYIFYLSLHQKTNFEDWKWSNVPKCSQPTEEYFITFEARKVVWVSHACIKGSLLTSCEFCNIF